MCDHTLWLSHFLKGATFAIDDAEYSLPGLTNDLADIHHAFVGVLHGFRLSFDDSVVARVIYHYKEISLLNHLLHVKLIIIKIN